jgi:hypothetical protein
MDRSGFVLPSSAAGCPRGWSPVRPPVENLNVGIISTSIGGHGASSCQRGDPGRDNDDRAHLIPTLRASAPNPHGQGFLQFRYGKEFDREEIREALRAQIEAVGTSGCQYPAPLEAAYRFLVDPSPADEIIVDAQGLSDAKRRADGSVVVDGH